MNMLLPDEYAAFLPASPGFHAIDVQEDGAVVNHPIIGWGIHRSSGLVVPVTVNEIVPDMPIMLPDGRVDQCRTQYPNITAYLKEQSLATSP